MAEARIDKWLWAVRLFKTRTLAADACKLGRVEINGSLCKPSRMVKEGDKICVRRPPMTHTFEVVQAIESRVGAKLVPQMLRDITPPEQIEAMRTAHLTGFVDRAKGTGRPTKRERRELDAFIDNDDTNFL